MLPPLPEGELICDALDNLESPIDLHEHHHEELVVRTEIELAEYEDIMNRPPSERSPAGTEAGTIEF